MRTPAKRNIMWQVLHWRKEEDVKLIAILYGGQLYLVCPTSSCLFSPGTASQAHMHCISPGPVPGTMQVDRKPAEISPEAQSMLTVMRRKGLVDAKLN